MAKLKPVRSTKPELAEVETEAAPPHPLAGQKMSGADMIVQVLADEGVDTIFGYSGGAILPTYDAIFRYNEGRPNPRRSAWSPRHRAGSGSWPGLRTLERPRRRFSRHLGSGRHQQRDAGARLSGRFSAYDPHLRPGAARGDGDRCIPGGAGLQHHGRLRQARLPAHR